MYVLHFSISWFNNTKYAPYPKRAATQKLSSHPFLIVLRFCGFRLADCRFQFGAWRKDNLHIRNHIRIELFGRIYCLARKRQTESSQSAQIDAFSHEQVLWYCVKQIVYHVANIAARQWRQRNNIFGYLPLRGGSLIYRRSIPLLRVVSYVQGKRI